jgi:hypothetical protein
MPPQQPIKLDIPDTIAQSAIAEIEAYLTSANPTVFPAGDDLTHALACAASHLIWQWPHSNEEQAHARVHIEYLPSQMIVQVTRTI